MKVAISSEGKDENSDMSEVSGRAKYYLIYEDGKLVKTIKNPFAVGGGGAGPAVAEMLGDENVDLILSGRFGDKMKDVLKSKKIKCKEISGMTIKEALTKVE